jgi:hypothetical protein
MRVTEPLACILMLLPGTCIAGMDPECTQHLGGAFADVECFNSLSKVLEADNERLANQIAAAIPAGNENQALLLSYQQAQPAQKRYCRLIRNSLTEWVEERSQQNPRYAFYDVAYYQCIYENLAHQNRFLKQLLHNASTR